MNGCQKLENTLLNTISAVLKSEKNYLETAVYGHISS